MLSPVNMGNKYYYLTQWYHTGTEYEANRLKLQVDLFKYNKIEFQNIMKQRRVRHLASHPMPRTL